MKRRMLATLLCLGVLFAALPAGGEAMVTVAPTATQAPVITTLSRGARGDAVKEIQKKLIELGFMTGSADGVFGAQTETGVKALEKYVIDIETAIRQEKRAQLLARAENERELRAEAYRLLAPAVTAADEAFQDNAETPAPEPAASHKINGRIDLVIAGAESAMKQIGSVKKPSGIVTEELIARLNDDTLIYREDLARGARGNEVVRLQTRLSGLRYLSGGIDGQFGPGTQAALQYFQKRNQLEQTGMADEATQRALFSEAAVKSDRPTHPYQVRISVGKQKVYVYKWTDGAYSDLVKTMRCSTGTKDNPTPYGSFSMGGPCGRWYYFQKFDCWAQYAYRITGGILFHSVLYGEKDTSTLRQGSVNALGSRASHGCVRLAVSDAKWLYNNVSAGSTCVIGK